MLQRIARALAVVVSAAAATAAADPVLLLHLDGDVGDASGRGHAATLLAGAWFDGGRWGDGLVVGAGGVAIADAPDLAIACDLTLAAWIRVDDASADAWMRVVSKKTAFDAHAGYELEYNPAQRRLTLDASDAAFLRSGIVDLDAGWHHVCATVHGTVGALYVDGATVARGRVGALAAGAGDLFVGRNPHGDARFAGAIDEVRVYATTLAPFDVWRLATAGLRAIGAWSFDEGAGSIAHDRSGLGYDGAITAATWTRGRLGGALAFAEPAVVEVGARERLAATGQVSILAVVRVADPGEDAWLRIVSKKTAYTDADGYELEYDPARRTLGLIGGGGDVALAEGVALGTAWHLIVGVIDGRSGRLFVDGVDRTTAGVVGPLRAGATPLAIGRVGGAPTSYWHGAIDEVTLLNFALIPARAAPLAPLVPLGPG